MSNQENSHWVDFFLLLKKWQRFLIINVSAFTLLALIIALLLPKWYRAEAKILSSGSEVGALGLSSLISDLPFEGLGLLPKTDETLRYLAILNSRTLMMGIIKQFDLQTRYDKPNWEKTLKELQENTNFDVNADESISIYALDKEPEFAAKMANTFVQKLDSINIALRSEKARNDRKFMQVRLDQNKQELAQAELNLKDFQEKYGVIEVTQQARAAVQTIAELEAQILLTETELRYKSNYLAASHQDIQNLTAEIKELKRSLHEIQFGTDGASSNSEPGFLISGRDVPGLAMGYFRALRDVEVQNIIYKILTQQLEQAKIMEAKQTPTLQVLDWAIPPVYKNRPKRSLIVLGALMFSALISIFYILSVEKWRQLKANLTN